MWESNSVSSILRKKFKILIGRIISKVFHNLQNLIGPFVLPDKKRERKKANIQEIIQTKKLG